MMGSAGLGDVHLINPRTNDTQRLSVTYLSQGDLTTASARHSARSEAMQVFYNVLDKGTLVHWYQVCCCLVLFYALALQLLTVRRLEAINMRRPDGRYGVKLDAAALLQDWVRDIGSRAGLAEHNSQILSGAIGVPESRLEARAPTSVRFECCLATSQKVHHPKPWLPTLHCCRHPGRRPQQTRRAWACRVGVQLEVEFDSLAELEQFWAAVPPDAHRAWSQRAQVHPRFRPLSLQFTSKDIWVSALRHSLAT